MSLALSSHQCAPGLGRGLELSQPSFWGFWVALRIPREVRRFLVGKSAGPGLQLPPYLPFLSPPACQCCTGFELECPRNAFIRQIALLIRKALVSACSIRRSSLPTETFKGYRLGLPTKG